MAVMLVSYDLNAPGQKYDNLIRAIQAYPNCKALKSAWLIETTQAVTAVRDNLRKHMDASDHIVIVKVTKGGWATFAAQAVSDWLNNPQRNWV